MRRIFLSAILFRFIPLLTTIWVCVAEIAMLTVVNGSSSTNQVPQVTIIFPPPGVVFSGRYLSIRVNAIDFDGTIAVVQYHANGQFIGSITNEPFSFRWSDPGDIGLVKLTAIAVDNVGATNVSLPVPVIAVQAPQDTIFRIVAPNDPKKNFNDSIVLPATVDFVFSARLATSNGLGEAARFFIDTNLVAIVTDPPYQIAVTNLSEGQHGLIVDTENSFKLPNFSSYGDGRNVMIVPLLIQQAHIDTNRSFAFRVAGRVAGKATVIEASTNLLTWQPIVTNLTSTNSFLFTDPQATNYQRRFYRASFKE